MKVKKHENISVIIPVSDEVTIFLEKIKSDSNLSCQHLILDFSSYKLIEDDLSKLLFLSSDYKSNKKSFVVVTDQFSYEKLPETLSVVPTVQEAFDTIEMEEIERDLGF